MSSQNRAFAVHLSSSGISRYNRDQLAHLEAAADRNPGATTPLPWHLFTQEWLRETSTPLPSSAQPMRRVPKVARGDLQRAFKLAFRRIVTHPHDLGGWGAFIMLPRWCLRPSHGYSCPEATKLLRLALVRFLEGD